MRSLLPCSQSSSRGAANRWKEEKSICRNSNVNRVGRGSSVAAGQERAVGEVQPLGDDVFDDK